MKFYQAGLELKPWELHGSGYWYLGSPYSKYRPGLEEAFEDICAIAGALIAQKINVFSPIAHTHPIAIHSMMDPLDHTIWLGADEPLMEAARGMILAEMKGWEDSYGLQVEQDFFIKVSRPIIHLRGF